MTSRITSPSERGGQHTALILPVTQRPMSRGLKPNHQKKIKGKEFLEKGTVKARKAERAVERDLEEERGEEGGREEEEEEEEGEEGEEKNRRGKTREKERKNMALASCMCKIRKELQ